MRLPKCSNLTWTKTKLLPFFNALRSYERVFGSRWERRLPNQILKPTGINRADEFFVTMDGDYTRVTNFRKSLQKGLDIYGLLPKLGYLFSGHIKVIWIKLLPNIDEQYDKVTFIIRKG